MSRELVGVIAVVVFVVVAALIAAAEAGLSFLSRARARALQAEERPGSALLLRLSLIHI